MGETFSFYFRRICGAAGDITTLCFIAVGAQTHFTVYQHHRGDIRRVAGCFKRSTAVALC